MMPRPESILRTVGCNLIIVKIHPFLPDVDNTECDFQTGMVQGLRRQKDRRANAYAVLP